MTLPKISILVWMLASISVNACGSKNALPQQPDWQAHALWCTRDKGSSGELYTSYCHGGADQYVSIMACQQNANNNGAMQALRDAGPVAVDNYMKDKKPSICQ
jgi:hypothetical protein